MDFQIKLELDSQKKRNKFENIFFIILQLMLTKRQQFKRLKKITN